MAGRKGSAEKQTRAWQRMLSGRRLDLLDPSPLDIELEDIAHGLARVMRWNGQTKGPQGFSVAQHSLLVERLCVHWRPGWPAAYRMAALLHDAPEYVIGDLISPFKAAIGADYKALEAGLLAAIHRRFGLPVNLPNSVNDLIKRADIYPIVLMTSSSAPTPRPPILKPFNWRGLVKARQKIFSVARETSLMLT